MSFYVVSRELTCESSHCLKSFCEKYKTVRIKLSWVMYLFMTEREALYLWISLNLVWHLSMLTLLILAVASGNSVCFLDPDEMDHCYFFSRFIICKSVAQNEQTSPCRRNRLWHQSHVTEARSVLGHFALAKPEACSPFLGGGGRGHGLPVPAGESAQPHTPFPGGSVLSCSIQLHWCFQR